jgi:hypothetical protein
MLSLIHIRYYLSDSFNFKLQFIQNYIMDFTIQLFVSYVGISSLTQSWTFQRNRLGCRVCIDEGGIVNRGRSRIRQGKLGYKIATGSPPHHQNPRVLGCWLSGGGDQGDFGEKSARPKPCSPSGNLGLVAREVQKKDLIVDMMASSSKG